MSEPVPLDAENPILAPIDDRIAELEFGAVRMRALRQTAEVLIDDEQPDVRIEIGGRLVYGSARVESDDQDAVVLPIRPGADDHGAPRPATDTRSNSKRDDVLACVQLHPQGVTPAAIADELSLSPTTVRKHLDDLEEAGRVLSEPHPDDDRKTLILPVRVRSAAKPQGAPRRGEADKVDRGKRATKAQKDRERLKQLVADSGPTGVNAQQVADELDIGIAAARTKLGQLDTAGAICASYDEPTVYRSPEFGMAPPDEDGAKTQTERALVAAIKAAPVALTTNEITAASGMSSPSAGAILAGLARRGVLRQVSDGGSPRWELAA